MQKGLGKCRNVQDVQILWFYFNQQKYFGTINFCGIAQVPLYIYIYIYYE